MAEPSCSPALDHTIDSHSHINQNKNMGFASNCNYDNTHIPNFTDFPKSDPLYAQEPQINDTQMSDFTYVPKSDPLYAQEPQINDTQMTNFSDLSKSDSFKGRKREKNEGLVGNVKKAKRVRKRGKRAKKGDSDFERMTVCDCDKRGDRARVAYFKDEIEALRYVGFEEQKRKWSEVYCGLGDVVAEEYDCLVGFNNGYDADGNYVSFDPRTQFADNKGVSSGNEPDNNGVNAGDLDVEEDYYEDEYSDSEYVSIQRPALYVTGEPDFDSGHPQDGLEYLRRISQQNQYPQMDRISNLPLNLLETILCLLPYREVVRTSTLSKEWRYHWTKITKINVIENFQTLNLQQKRIHDRKLLPGVGQALLMHKGPIHEVTLSVVADDYLCPDTGMDFDTGIRRIISHLSSNKAVKKLTLDFVSPWWGCRSNTSLPVSLFSMSQLTDLCINGCEFRNKPRFSLLKRRRKAQTSWVPKKKKKQNKTSSGFGSLSSLTSLYLINSKISIKAILHLLSTCPLLKTVALRTHDFYDYDGVTYTNLVESFMLTESLTIWCRMIGVLAAPVPGGYYHRIIPQKLPNALVHLKYLCIEGLDFVYCYGKPVISLLIRNSPNLEKLKLNINDEKHGNEMHALSHEYYADIWLEHLTELEITYLSNQKTELDIVKLILMGSPALKKLRIFISPDFKEKELEISETLLESLHASSVAAEFIVENEPF